MKFVPLGLFGLAAICLYAALVVGSRLRPEAVSEITSGLNEATVNVLPQRPSEAGPIRMVRFVLFKEGIYPRELKVEKGLINLNLEDKTNSSSGLMVERLRGSERSPVGQVRRVPNHWRGRGILNLSPGLYEVYDASRPANRAVLIVNP